MSASIPTLRLDRLLANMGYGSRKDIQAYVKAGQIMLDGAKVTDAGSHVPVSRALSARMTIAGKRLDPTPGVVLMMHKPVGVTCSHKETGRLVYELLPPRWRDRKPAISTIGRLDKETSGLLLLTDDGALLHRVIAPKSNVSKRYHVTLARPLKGDEGAALASGTLMLDGEDKPLLPVLMEPVAMEIVPNAPVSGHPIEVCVHVHVTLTEGRYHQVRRMFAALGNHVVSLHRDRVGGLPLPPDLEPGHYRVLEQDAIDRIFG
jgi:16S rRNA pseudouridine516 synthase